MIQWTTPEIKLTVQGVDLTEAEQVIVTLTQGNTTIEKTLDDVTLSVEGEDSILTFDLAESESKQFATEKSVQVQVNWTYESVGKKVRASTNIVQISIEKQLHKAAMTND